MKIDRVPVDHIDIPPRLRAVDVSKVSRLAESIGAIGLQAPITLYQSSPDAEGFDLIAGAHRLEAVRSLGWEWIDAIFMQADEIDRQLWEIDENLMRSELTPTQQAEHLAKRKELWDAKQESGPSCPTFTGRGNKQFAAETSEATSLSKRALNRAISRANNITEEARDAIRGTELDKGVVLDELKKVPPSQQMQRVAELREAPSPQEEHHSRLTKALRAWRMLSPDEKDAFLDALQQEGYL